MRTLKIFLLLFFIISTSYSCFNTEEPKALKAGDEEIKKWTEGPFLSAYWNATHEQLTDNSFDCDLNITFRYYAPTKAKLVENYICFPLKKDKDGNDQYEKRSSTVVDENNIPDCDNIVLDYYLDYSEVDRNATIPFRWHVEKVKSENKKNFRRQKLKIGEHVELRDQFNPTTGRSTYAPIKTLGLDLILDLRLDSLKNMSRKHLLIDVIESPNKKTKVTVSSGG